MAIQLDPKLTPVQLLPKVRHLFELSAAKIRSIEKTWRPEEGTPVFTVRGRYTSRGWTEWTQGFQVGAAILQYDATGEEEFLKLGRRQTLELMAPHLTHLGVHDHGFNNISTYGNLLRLILEGRLEASPAERAFHELALKVSGAVQAARWTRLADGTGFIHSFNGPHSLFVDTIRSCRVLAVAHLLGQRLMGEQDEAISLLGRLVEHAANTARYNVYYGQGRDAYDIRGRTAHEAVFNVRNGLFRCPNSQQGWSPFSTWTRGLAWAVCGFAEQLEFFQWHRPRLEAELKELGFAPAEVRRTFLDAATATADFYLENCCADGIPMWDTGAPNLHRLPEDYLQQPSNPYNRWEPVDSSAAAIAAQGLLRLSRFLETTLAAGEPPFRQAKAAARRYRLAGLKIADTLFSEPYLSSHPRHQGLILHSVYHLPNGWDHIPRGMKVPCGESSMWGDYHAREVALWILREAEGAPYLTFFSRIGLPE